LLPNGWAHDVVIEIDESGTIASVARGVDDANAERCAGPVVPAMTNVHSHAFQRALAGRTGRASPAHDDSFWTWRESMYAFLARVDADVFAAIAAQAYVEMAKAGYALVAEFHYVHHDPHGKTYADPAELSWRIVAAAEEVGLGLTLLPVFYAQAGFGSVAPRDDQRRFVHSIDSYRHLIAILTDGAATRRFVLGVAPHSLRAIAPDELAWSGLRPVEWLLKHANVDRRWCVVHATHMTGDETRALARSGAVAGLAPTTEADLGDGTFPAIAYVLTDNGAFGIGSDSNTIIDPFAELRQLEWSQRLRDQRRNVLASGDVSVGLSLWARAARGGAQAAGRKSGAIAPGHGADLVVLNASDPALALQRSDDVLDAAIFGPCKHPVRDVMSGGVWIVRDGHHAHETETFARYRAALRSLET